MHKVNHSFDNLSNLTTTMMISRVFALSLVVSSAFAFVPSSFVKHAMTSSTEMKMMDPSVIDVASVSGMMESASQLIQQTSSLIASSEEGLQLGDTMSNFVSETSNLLSFSDQGQNLAGIFFQASLLPYLLFLYFLSFRANRISNVGNFGFQFILLFVISTIPSGIISKATYGTSLADCDWLHGGAELLLTTANVLLVCGMYDRLCVLANFIVLSFVYRSCMTGFGIQRKVDQS